MCNIVKYGKCLFNMVKKKSSIDRAFQYTTLPHFANSLNHHTFTHFFHTISVLAQSATMAPKSLLLISL